MQSKLHIVTGATSGIGMATARRLAADGHRVAAVGRNEDALARLGADAKERIVGYRADLMELERIPELVARIRDQQGPIGGLVNAAGVIMQRTIEQTSDAEVEAMVRLNVTAPFSLMRSCLPDLREAAGAAVVNVSSVTGLRPFPGCPRTACPRPRSITSRAARPSSGPSWGSGSTRSTRASWSPISTSGGGMSETSYEQFLERTVGAHPLGRVGQPDEIADLIAFLLSEKSGWITGETIAIDGGRHLTAAR